MKVALVCLVIFGVVGVSLARTACSNQSDCGEDECCLDNLTYRSCEKRYGAGQKCDAPSIYKKQKDLYYLTCPCIHTYECLGKGALDVNGNTILKDPKCIRPM